ncbi:sodium:solute symporter, partial [bacterium]
MNSLGTADYAVVVGYFCLLVGLGLWFRRRASASLEDYFLGGRKMPWWAMGISGMSSFIDMAGTMLIVSFLYMLGPRGLYIEFRGGAVLVLTFMLLWSGKWHYRSRCMTGAEWMEYRFGSGWGGQAARLLSAVAVIITTVGMIAYMIKALGFFASMFLPFSPEACALIMIGAATLYTVASGFYGVVYTDLFQSIIVVSAAIFITVLAATKVAALGDVAALAYSVTGDPHWTSSALPWETAMPKGYEVYGHLTLFAFFYLLRNMLIGMSSAGADPRYFGARSERECGTLSFLWTWLMTLRWPMMIGFAVLGLFLVDELFPQQGVLAQAATLIKTALPEVPKERWTDTLAALRNVPEQFPPALVQGLKDLLQGDWAAKLQMVSYEGTVNPESIVPAVILFYIPIGIRGFIVVAFVAAALSVFNSTVNMTTAYFTRDIFQRYISRKAHTRKLLMASYLFALLLVISGLTLAYYLHSINQIWGWVMMGLGGGIAVPSMLKFYWWRFNGTGFAAGTAVGIAAAIVQALLWPGLPEWQQFLIVAAVSLLATIVGTYAGKPIDESVITRFYRTTRPFGFWKPYKAMLDPAVRTAMEREHRNDLLAVPFTLGWQITLFLLPMQLLIRSGSDLPLTFGIFVVCLAGLYWFWYRR